MGSETVVGGPPGHDQHAALVEAIAANRDRQAFADLFQHFAPRIKSYGLRAGIDASTAEELAQEVMIAVWRKAVRFDRTRATASTWIFAIARNRRIDLLRRENRPEVEADTDVAFDSGTSRAADETYATNQSAALLHRSINDLPAEQAEILRKSFFEDKPHRVISDELGLPLGTVKSRIRLALARLRLLLSEQDP